jgi:hypothetical protein
MCALARQASVHRCHHEGGAWARSMGVSRQFQERRNNPSHHLAFTCCSRGVQHHVYNCDLACCNCSGASWGKARGGVGHGFGALHTTQVVLGVAPTCCSLWQAGGTWRTVHGMLCGGRSQPGAGALQLAGKSLPRLREQSR